MSRKTAAPAIYLIRTKQIAAKFHPELGNSVKPFSYFCANFHSTSHKDRRFSPKPRINFGSVNELDDALSLFHEMLRMQPQPSVIDFTKLLNIVVKMKHYTAAVYLFDEMRQRGAPVNEYTFSIAINCYSRLKRVDFGFAILGIFFKSGYDPDVPTFTTLIKGLFLDHKAADAVKLFQKLFNLKICEPNEVMMLTVIDGLCKAGQIIEAHNLVSRLQRTRCRPNVLVYSALIDGLCKGRMVDDAFRLLSKMLDKGVSPNVVTYNSMIQGLCDVGRLTDVRDLLDAMAKSNICLDEFTFNILIDAYCKEGKVVDAENIFENMLHQNLCCPVCTYNTLIDGYCLRGEMKRAKQLLDIMVERGLKPDIVSYNSLINGYCKQGRVDRAWLLFVKVPCKGLEYDTLTYATMMHGLFSKDRFVDGWKLFKDMEARRVSPDLQTYNILLDGLCKNGETDEALMLLRKMETKGVNPNIFTYGVLINGLCKRGKHDVARELFHQLPSRGLKPNVRVYTMIISSLCEENSFEEAICLLKEMESRGCVPDSVTYNIIVRNLLKENELYKAIPFLEEMPRRGFSADTATFSLLLDQVQGHTEDLFLLKLMKNVLPKENALTSNLSLEKMNEIREVAKAYFDGGKKEEKELARQFFKSLDADNNGVICIQEYKEYVSSSLSSLEVFKQLDKNGDKTLDFEEVLALYYMDKVSIPRCRACHEMLLASYFSCVPCLGKNSYTLCCNCYGRGKFEHHHSSGEFADTRALLKLLDQIMEKAEVRKNCEEDGDNCEKNDADDGEPKRSTSRSKSEIILDTLEALNAGLCVGGAAVTLAGTIAVSSTCCIM